MFGHHLGLDYILIFLKLRMCLVINQQLQLRWQYIRLDQHISWKLDQRQKDTASQFMSRVSINIDCLNFHKFLLLVECLLDYILDLEHKIDWHNFLHIHYQYNCIGNFCLIIDWAVSHSHFVKNLNFFHMNKEFSFHLNYSEIFNYWFRSHFCFGSLPCNCNYRMLNLDLWRHKYFESIGYS